MGYAILFALMLPGEFDASKVVKQVQRAVVPLMVMQDDHYWRRCSAIAVTPTMAITGEHCVNDVQLEQLFINNEQPLRITTPINSVVGLVMRHPQKWKVIEIRTTPLHLGESVIGLGFAYGDTSLTVTVGTVAHPAGYIEDRNSPLKEDIWFDLTTMGGMSGGPIVDVKGKLISMIQGSATDRPGGSNSLSFGPSPATIQKVKEGK